MTTSASYASATIGSTCTTSHMDYNHPYYLHPSDNPRIQLTSLILTESN